MTEVSHPKQHLQKTGRMQIKPPRQESPKEEELRTSVHGNLSDIILK